MFGVDLTEFIVVIALGVILIGPKDIPNVIYSVGKVFRKIKDVTSDVNRSIEVFMTETELREIADKADKSVKDESKDNDRTA